MEQLNKVILRGCIGSIRSAEISDTKVYRFTLATNLAYRDRENCPVIETTWSQCVCFPGKDIDARMMDSLQRGDRVEVTGRLRNSRYTGEDGVERTMTEIRAYRVEVINSDATLQYEDACHDR